MHPSEQRTKALHDLIEVQWVSEGKPIRRTIKPLSITNSESPMLKPETVTRDPYGDWTHSVLEAFVGGRELIPGPEWKAWCQSHGIETLRVEMEMELDETHPAWIRHFDDGEPGSVGWNPESPSEDWHMLSIHDTEDGPVVVWYREHQEA